MIFSAIRLIIHVTICSKTRGCAGSEFSILGHTTMNASVWARLSNRSPSPFSAARPTNHGPYNMLAWLLLLRLSYPTHQTMNTTNSEQNKWNAQHTPKRKAKNRKECNKQTNKQTANTHTHLSINNAHFPQHGARFVLTHVHTPTHTLCCLFCLRLPNTQTTRKAHQNKHITQRNKNKTKPHNTNNKTTQNKPNNKIKKPAKW